MSNMMPPSYESLFLEAEPPTYRSLFPNTLSHPSSTKISNLKNIFIMNLKKKWSNIFFKQVLLQPMTLTQIDWFKPHSTNEPQQSILIKALDQWFSLLQPNTLPCHNMLHPWTGTTNSYLFFLRNYFFYFLKLFYFF